MILCIISLSCLFLDLLNHHHFSPRNLNLIMCNSQIPLILLSLLLGRQGQLDWRVYTSTAFLLVCSLSDNKVIGRCFNNWRKLFFFQHLGFPGGSVSKESACNAGDLGSIPESGRSPEEGDGNPHQDSCLENSMDRGAWLALVQGLMKSQT